MVFHRIADFFIQNSLIKNISVIVNDLFLINFCLGGVFLVNFSFFFIPDKILHNDTLFDFGFIVSDNPVCSLSLRKGIFFHEVLYLFIFI